MIFSKKNSSEKSRKANERMVRKVLGKNPERKVFGFPCSPDIPGQLKMLADKLHVPLYGLAEHAFQLAAGQIARMADSADESELLRQHISDVHVGRRTIEKISRFDEEMADDLDRERQRRFQFEQAVRQIVLKYNARGVRPSLIDWAVDYGIRCRSALIKGQPPPTDLPPTE